MTRLATLYAERLNCVEIRYTFPRLLSASTLKNWVAQTAPASSSP